MNLERLVAREAKQFYHEDPLCDGYGCNPGNSCCAQAGMPWFCWTLPQEVNEDIDLHLCSEEGILGEETYAELLELSVQ